MDTYTVTSETGDKVVKAIDRVIALHEAGHVVASFFLGVFENHITEVVLLGDGAGRVSKERSWDARNSPFIMAIPAAIVLMAGWAAERLILPRRNFSCCPDEGSDYFRAEQIVSTITDTKFKPRGIFTACKRWTVEMVSIPKIESVISQIASKLLDEKRITDAEWMRNACKDIQWAGHQALNRLTPDRLPKTIFHDINWEPPF